MADEESDAARTRSDVPVDMIPAPVVKYDVQDDEPVVAGTNDAFDRTFGHVQAGTPVCEWLDDATAATDSAVETVRSSLADGAEVDIELDLERGDGESRGRTVGRVRTFDGDAKRYVLLTGIGSPVNAANETDRIASVISHDLRNPLDVANAHLQAARETGEKEHFDEVRQSHDRIQRIIQDVLTLARGESALDTVTGVDVEAVATDAWATVDTRGASLAVDGDLPTVEADPDRLQRLFENLFRNSVEHGAGARTDDAAQPSQSTDSSGRGVGVRVGRVDGGFFVADDGPGVPPADRTRVFDPGYSGNGTTGGTGLGLTIVEEIADAHDWTVSLTSGERGGARFEFRPRPEADADGHETRTDGS